LPARAAVAEELPVGSSAPDLLRGNAFVLAVVVLLEQGRDLEVRVAGQGGRLLGPLHGRGVDGDEARALETGGQPAGPVLTGGRERDVGAAGVAAAEAPLGLAVTGEPEL